MKKFDITPLLPFYDRIAEVCRDAFRREGEVTPQGLLEELMDIPGLPMHCPPLQQRVVIKQAFCKSFSY